MKITAPSVATTAATAAARYAVLEVEREPFLRRARKCASLTIPALLPPQGHNSSADLPQPWQSAGADGVNNLSAKLLLALLPPGHSPFKLSLDSFVLEELREKAGAADFTNARAEIENVLARIERSVTTRIEQRGHRTTVSETFKHLIVTGNGLLTIQPDASLKFYPLDRYVVKRDLSGNVLEIITKETLARTALPPNILKFVEALPTREGEQPTSEQKTIDLYTWVQRTARGWTVQQQVQGHTIPGTVGRYPLNKSAWLPLRWTAVSGEDYGRGRAEEYLGDLMSHEVLTKAIVTFAVAAAKVIVFVDPSGQVTVREIEEAESGAVKEGKNTDVTVLQLEKGQDFSIANTIRADLQSRLEKAFLHTSSVQRQAERVTAEEIRLMASELESSLGGVYSILADEWQRPYITRLMHVMESKGDLPSLPEGAVSPQIVTGLEGLGRNADLVKLDAFVANIAQAFGPEAVSQWINVGNYLKQRAAALGVDTEGLLRSDDEIAQMQQQQQMQSLAESLGPQAIKSATDAQLATQAPAAPVA